MGKCGGALCGSPWRSVTVQAAGNRAVVVLGHVSARQDRDDAGGLARHVGVDGLDRGMGVGRAHKGGRQLARAVKCRRRSDPLPVRKRRSSRRLTACPTDPSGMSLQPPFRTHRRRRQRAEWRSRYCGSRCSGRCCPPARSRISCSLGFAFFCRRSTALITIPGVQSRTAAQWCSWKAACMGWRSPPRPGLRWW